MTIAGEASVADNFSDQKLKPKCNAPLHSATAISNRHCPALGRFRKGNSNRASKARRKALNSNGGNSRSASFEVRKFPAQARQISAISAKSRPDSRSRESIVNVE